VTFHEIIKFDGFIFSKTIKQLITYQVTFEDSLQQAAENVLPFGSASRDCKEFCPFFDSLANPTAPISGISATFHQTAGNALAVQFDNSLCSSIN
jgi:hypothetical protein